MPIFSLLIIMQRFSIALQMCQCTACTVCFLQNPLFICVQWPFLQRHLLLLFPTAISSEAATAATPEAPAYSSSSSLASHDSRQAAGVAPAVSRISNFNIGPLPPGYEHLQKPPRPPAAQFVEYCLCDLYNLHSCHIARPNQDMYCSATCGIICIVDNNLFNSVKRFWKYPLLFNQ